jgi:hypothetical protein
MAAARWRDYREPRESVEQLRQGRLHQDSIVASATNRVLTLLNKARKTTQYGSCECGVFYYKNPIRIYCYSTLCQSLVAQAILNFSANAEIRYT